MSEALLCQAWHIARPVYLVAARSRCYRHNSNNCGAGALDICSCPDQRLPCAAADTQLQLGAAQLVN